MERVDLRHQSSQSMCDVCCAVQTPSAWPGQREACDDMLDEAGWLQVLHEGGRTSRSMWMKHLSRGLRTTAGGTAVRGSQVTEARA